MSYDYILYLKHSVDRFSREDCEAFLRERGLDAHIPADFDPQNHGGFLEIRPIIHTEEADEAQRSGFEYDIAEHEYQPITRKPTLWERLRGVSPEPEPDPYPDAVQDVFLSCRWITSDTESIPLALAFAGYLALTCEGVLYDPQAGRVMKALADIDVELQENRSPR